MTFEIQYDKQPTLFLKKSDKHISKRILEKLEGLLKENPVPHQAKAIVGEHGVFRVRIGEYRALYRIDHQDKKIIIFEIDKRPKVY
ncbi:MAG TPA: type II toxin-antitoxin system RelE/ParE family toxin [Nanoarchaeota archaeon]|nr:type II toxin-antitoxin system RelE/ParE family toxin [Nanoarchaeota archaeon]HIH66417.1 type II toxin-antitoxin system RelE/ParE family toxin [Nanoarchaeota archaeon]